MNIPKLHQFLELFEKWNRSINLSAASTRAELEEHRDDSLHVVPLLAPAMRVIDVGSGGGFPVVIAAICAPTIEFVSLEPVHKKQAFLKTAARELELDNLVCRAERAEVHGDHDYDVAMSRATFDLAEWLVLGAKLVRTGGRVFGFEGQLRADLGAIERHPYEINRKPRAIVVRTV